MNFYCQQNPTIFQAEEKEYFLEMDPLVREIYSFWIVDWYLVLLTVMVSVLFCHK